MNKVNYQKELEKILQSIVQEGPRDGDGRGSASRDGAAAPFAAKKKLLIHSCCAPCSSYVLEYLRGYFEITVLYYNPNITDREEYEKRVAEQERLIQTMNKEASEECESPKDALEAAAEGPCGPSSSIAAAEGPCGPSYPIAVEEGPYEPERFFEMAKGLERLPEGGERCFRCYEMRLRETARFAAERAKEGKGFDYFTTTLTISPLKNAEKLNEIGQRLAEEYGVRFLPSDFKKKNGYKRSVELSERYGLYRQDYCGCAFSKAERQGRKQGAFGHPE